MAGVFSGMEPHGASLVGRQAPGGEAAGPDGSSAQGALGGGPASPGGRPHQGAGVLSRSRLRLYCFWLFLAMTYGKISRCVDAAAVHYHVKQCVIRLVQNLLQELFPRGCGGGPRMQHGMHLSRGAARRQHVQPEPRPRLLDNGRPAPAASRSTPVVVRGHAGLVSEEKQDSLRLRTLHGSLETLPAGPTT